MLETLTRGNQEVSTQAIEEAETEVSGYLSARYDMVAELSKTHESKDRNTMVVKLVRDIAIFNIYNFNAPVNIPDNKVKCYENAVSILKAAQSEKAAIVGLSRLTTGEQGVASSYIAFGGNEKRENHI